MTEGAPRLTVELIVSDRAGNWLDIDVDQVAEIVEGILDGRHVDVEHEGEEIVGVFVNVEVSPEGA